MKFILSLLSFWFGISLYDDNGNVKHMVSDPSYARIAVMRWKQDYRITMNQASWEITTLSHRLSANPTFREIKTGVFGVGAGSGKPLLRQDLPNIPAAMNSIRTAVR